MPRGQHRAQQSLLRPEVVEDQSLGHAGSRGDLQGRGGVEASGGEQVEGDIEQLLSTSIRLLLSLRLCHAPPLVLAEPTLPEVLR